MRLKLKYDCQYGFKEMYMTETDLEYDADVALMAADYAARTDLELSDEDIAADYLFVDHLEDIYEKFKTRPMNLFAETADNEEDSLLDGEIATLEDALLEDAYHSIFKKLTGQFPGYFKMYNCRLVLENTDESPVLQLSDNTVITVNDLHDLTADTETITVNVENCDADEARKLLKDAKAVAEGRLTAVEVGSTRLTSTMELTSQTACAMLGISRQTLANWVKAGKVKRLPNGKYKYEELKQLLHYLI